MKTRNVLFIFTRNKKIIIFLDVEKNCEMLHVFSTAPNKPGRLCTASPNILLFEDRSTYPMAVNWLDCRSTVPRPLAGVDISHTQQGSADDISCIYHDQNMLLVVTKSLEGMYAYDVSKDALAWKVEGQVGLFAKQMTPESIATSQGHLFVGDCANSCIQVFTTYGVYLGYIEKELGQASTQPPRISWCNSMSSLLVARRKGEQYQISMVQNLSGEVLKGQGQDTHQQGHAAPKKTQNEAEVTVADAGALKRINKLIGQTSETDTGRYFTVDDGDAGLVSYSIEDTTNASISTTSCEVSFISVLLDNSIVVCGKTNNVWKLIRCDMACERREQQGTLDGKPGGMALITVDTRLCLAVSYR